MTVYNKAHALANAIKTSSEFQNYQRLTKQVYDKDQNKQMIDDFRDKVMKFQLDQLETGKEDQAEMEKLHKLQQVLMLNSEINEFLMAEMRFSQIIRDVYKIIDDAIKLSD